MLQHIMGGPILFDTLIFMSDYSRDSLVHKSLSPQYAITLRKTVNVGVHRCTNTNTLKFPSTLTMNNTNRYPVHKHWCENLQIVIDLGLYL